MSKRPNASFANPCGALPSSPGTCAFRAASVSCTLVLTASLLASTMAAAAPMYKWIDANGQTVYSDQPPPASVKAEIIKPPPPPANPNAVKDMVNADTEMKLREKQRIENAREAAKARSDAEKRQEICATSLGQIKTLQREDLYRFDAKGQRIYLDADIRRREIEQQQKVVRENCPA